MNTIIQAAMIVGTAVVFTGWAIASVVEKGFKNLVEAIGTACDALPKSDHGISIAINSLGRDVAAVRRKLRDEPEPPTLEEKFAQWIDKGATETSVRPDNEASDEPTAD